MNDREPAKPDDPRPAPTPERLYWTTLALAACVLLLFLGSIGWIAFGWPLPFPVRFALALLAGVPAIVFIGLVITAGGKRLRNMDIYREADKPAENAKGLIHMAIGVIVVVVAFVIVGHILMANIRMLWAAEIKGRDGNPPETTDLLSYALHVGLGIAGLGLALATVVELAHTLYTKVPDEALNPVMLALAAAIVLQLADLTSFDLKQSTGLILCVLALAGLFATREWIAKFDNGDAKSPSAGKTGDVPSSDE